MNPRARIAAAFGARAVYVLASVGVAAVLILALFTAAPGDAIDALPNGPEVRAVLAREWGLGGTPVQRFVTGLIRIAQLDFGHSLTWRPGASVRELVADAAKPSLRLLGSAWTLSLVAGLLGGLLAREGRGLRAGVRAVVAATTLPAALAGLAVINGVNAGTWELVQREIIGRPAWFALPQEAGPVRLLLAAAVLAWSSGHLGRLYAGSAHTLAELSRAPFMVAEAARGGPLAPMYARHLVVPLARLGATQLPALLSSLLVVERAFGLPGAGSAFWEACRLRDWPVAAGFALAATFLVAFARLAAEAVAVLVDPREREAGS